MVVAFFFVAVILKYLVVFFLFVLIFSFKYLSDFRLLLYIGYFFFIFFLYYL